MKNKKFKPSKNYRRDFGAKRVQSGGSKRPWIIGIAIAVAALLIAAIVYLVVTWISINNLFSGVPGGSNVSNNQSNSNQGGSQIIEDGSVEPEVDEIAKLLIIHLPTKQSYYCGEALETAGLSVYCYTKNDKYIKLKLTDCEITGFDSSAAVAQQTITVSYQGFSDAFSVSIKEAPKPVENPVVSVVVETLPKTEYKLNEFLETTGGVLLCTYADGTTKRVDLEPEYVTGFRYAMKVGAGEHELTVTYTEKSVSVETTYKITIAE